MSLIFDSVYENGGSFADCNRIDSDPGATPIGSQIAASGVPGEYEYVMDPTGRYGRVAKLTIPRDSPGRREPRPFQYYPTAPAVGGVFGDQFWAWTSFMFNDEWPSEEARGVDSDSSLVPSGRAILIQIHEAPDSGDLAHFPSFQMYAWGKKLGFCTTADPAALTTSRIPNLKVMHSVPLVKNHWYEVVLNAKLAINTSGFLRVYIDRRKVFTDDGVITYYNDDPSRGGDGAFYKAGLYKYSDSYSPPHYHMYSRGIRMGDASSSFSEVSGGITELSQAVYRRSVVRGNR